MLLVWTEQTWVPILISDQLCELDTQLKSEQLHDLVSFTFLLCEMEIMPTLQGVVRSEIMAIKHLTQCLAQSRHHDYLYLSAPELLFFFFPDALDPLYL